MIINFNKFDNTQNETIYHYCLYILEFLKQREKEFNIVLNTIDKESDKDFLSLFETKIDALYFCEEKKCFYEKKSFLKMGQYLYITFNNNFKEKDNKLFFVIEILYYYNNIQCHSNMNVLLEKVNNNFICNFEKTKELLCNDYIDAFKIAEKYEKQQQEKNKNILSGEKVKEFIKKYDDNKVVLLKSNSDYDNNSNYYAFDCNISLKEFLKIVKNKDFFSGLKIFNKKQIIEEECIDENKYPKEQVEDNYKDFTIVNFCKELI